MKRGVEKHLIRCFSDREIDVQTRFRAQTWGFFPQVRSVCKCVCFSFRILEHSAAPERCPGILICASSPLFPSSLTLIIITIIIISLFRSFVVTRSVGSSMDSRHVGT